MRVVVSDTGPLNYLLLIDTIDVLPKLFGTILVPEPVQAELRDPGASLLVRRWAAHPPSWVEIRVVSTIPEHAPSSALDPGEVAAIALATQIPADLLLIDDRAGVSAASQLGLPTIGTLGILVAAARRDLVDLAVVFDRLKATNFRYRKSLLETLLAQHAAKR